MDQDKEAVAEQLRDYLRLIGEIKSMYGEVNAIPLDQKPMAQARMKELKARLRADYDRLNHPGKGSQVNDTEDAFLRPAVEGAFNHVRVKWNSNPAGWRGDLAEASVDISHYLSELTR